MEGPERSEAAVTATMAEGIDITEGANMKIASVDEEGLTGGVIDIILTMIGVAMIFEGAGGVAEGAVEGEEVEALHPRRKSIRQLSHEIRV